MLVVDFVCRNILAPLMVITLAACFAFILVSIVFFTVRCIIDVLRKR